MEQVELYERTETKHYATYKHYGIKKHYEASCITMEQTLYETPRDSMKYDVSQSL
jgi:hypothetical protein